MSVKINYEYTCDVCKGQAKEPVSYDVMYGHSAPLPSTPSFAVRVNYSEYTLCDTCGQTIIEAMQQLIGKRGQP